MRGEKGMLSYEEFKKREEQKKKAVSKIICMLRDEGLNTAQIISTAEMVTESVTHYSVVLPDYSSKLEKESKASL